MLGTDSPPFPPASDDNDLTFGRCDSEASAAGLAGLGDRLRDVGNGGLSGSDDASPPRRRRAGRARLQLLSTPPMRTATDAASGCCAAARRHAGGALYVATKVPPKDWHWPAAPSRSRATCFPYDWIVEMDEEEPREPRRGDDRPASSSTCGATPGRRRRLAPRGRGPQRQGLIRGFGISVNRWEPKNVLARARERPRRQRPGRLQHLDQTRRTRCSRVQQARCRRDRARCGVDEGGLTGA